METAPADSIVQPPSLAGGVPAQKPVCITVFGILNIVFASLGLLCMPFSMLIVFFVPNQLALSAAYKGWLVFSFVFGFACAIWELVLGIGLLNLKRWARSGSVLYGMVAIGFGILGQLVNVATMFTGSMKLTAESLPGYLGGVIGGLIGLVYPILLIVFMRKPNVVAVFNHD